MKIINQIVRNIGYDLFYTEMNILAQHRDARKTAKEKVNQIKNRETDDSDKKLQTVTIG